MSFWQLYGEAAKTSFGFFWKSGWAFMLGYWVSAMIQAFVPKGRLTPLYGHQHIARNALWRGFLILFICCACGCHALVLRGVNFVAAVAFKFASTNLVIELGILILIFLGWQFLAAEVIGGLILIGISSVLIKLTYPKRWFREARERVEDQAGDEESDFDWRRRIRSRAGWNLVGHRFVYVTFLLAKTLFVSTPLIRGKA
ncbi:MAG: permease [Anaerolineales bacterium]|nr:permease [Anaerolineales bacterium]